MLIIMPLALPEQRIIQTVSLPNKEIGLFVQRDDLSDPWLGGNKVYKLRENLMAFRRSGKKALLTFGGAWSNHLVATAELCSRAGIPVVGIVRGEENRNPRLDFLRSAGMRLVFSEREQYRRKEDEASQTFYCQAAARELDCSPSDFQVVPEGGSNEAGFQGSKRILDPAISSTFTHVVVACGTGTTLAGLTASLLPHQQAIGIAVVHDLKNIRERLRTFGVKDERYILLDDFVFGGYAKKNAELLEFCTQFGVDTGIPIEPVYTGKAFFAVIRMINENYFPKGSKVLIIHTGGLYPCDAAFEICTSSKLAVSNS